MGFGKKKKCNTEGTQDFTDNLTSLSVKKGCRRHWNAGLDSQIIYLDQHKNCMATGYVCLLELKADAELEGTAAELVLFFALSSAEQTPYIVPEGTVILGKSLRQCQTIRFCWIAGFSRCFHLTMVLTRELGWSLELPPVEKRAFGCPEKRGVNNSVFLVYEIVCGNITHLRHSRFIQSLEAYRGGLWPDKCLQSENYIFLVFVYKKWNFDFSFPSFSGHVAGFLFIFPLGILSSILFLIIQKGLYWIFYP